MNESAPIPEGNLTRAQHEIMEVVWGSASQGATVSEIWEAVSLNRNVTRTTVLNLVNRLEKRQWLKRSQAEGVYRYRTTISQEETAELLVGEFVDDYFGGAASNLVLSLLGSKKLNSEDINRLRQLLNSDSNNTSQQDKNQEEGK